MIAADLVRAVAIAVLVLVRGPAQIWLIYLVLIVESVGTLAFRPAAQAHTPAVVGTGTALSGANSLNAVTDGVVRLIGAPLGGALFAWAGWDLVVWLDTATYLVSAAAILLTTAVHVLRDSGAARGIGRVLADLSEGLAFLRADRTARTLLLVNTLFLGANAGLTPLLVPYGITMLGGSGQAGLVMSGLGLGFLLGAPLMRVLVDRLPPGYLLGGSLALTGVGFIVLFRSTGPAGAVPIAVLIGAAGSTTLGSTQTTLQRVTPNELLGRTSAAMFTGEAVATFAGAIIGPALAGALSVGRAAILAGGATVLTGALAVLLLPRRAAGATVEERSPGSPG